MEQLSFLDLVMGIFSFSIVGARERWNRLSMLLILDRFSSFNESHVSVIGEIRFDHSTKNFAVFGVPEYVVDND